MIYYLCFHNYTCFLTIVVRKEIHSLSLTFIVTYKSLEFGPGAGCFNVTRGKAMYEEHIHLCAVALTSMERGTQFFPLASHFLLRSPTALRLLPGE